MATRVDGEKLPKREYEARLPVLRERLVEMQLALKDASFPVIFIIAGEDAAGKGEVANLLTGWLDPRGFETHAFSEPTDEERERPVMWRYWRTLPSRGRMAIHVGGWHADALALEPGTPRQRAEFVAAAQRLARFEQLLAADGVLIVKVWLHLSKRDQGERLHELESDVDTAWRVTPQDWRHHREYNRRAKLAEQLRGITNKPGAPWLIVEASDSRSRNLAVTEHVLARFAAHSAKADPAAGRTKPRRVASIASVGIKRLKAVDLSQELSEKVYQKKRDKLLGRLNRAVRAAAAKKRSVVWVFEGWDAAGKGGAIRRLTSAIDARDCRVIPIAKPTDEEKAHHYLWRFWRHLPRAGKTTIYDRSWYGRVLVERIEGFCSSAEWRRAYDEMNDFEAQLTAHGVIVLKFWLQLSPDEQLRRFKARAETPYKRHKIGDEDWRNRRQWRAYEVAIGDMLALTHTRNAPWHLVAANDKRFARVEVLKVSCEQINAALKRRTEANPG